MHRGAQANGVGGGGGGANGGPPSRLRHVSNSHHRSHSHHHHHHKDKGVVDLSHFLADNNSLTSDPDQPASASNLRRHLVASLMQHHRTVDKNSHALQPVSPASYGSSIEVAPYNPAVTPTSSLDFRGRIGESHYNLKTSTELIKVLNRIWSLEEQHASNMSLIKALKTELDQSRLKVKELLRERQLDRRGIDDMVKQIAGDKLARKSKEQDRIQSVREELEDERRLRKRSEGIHRKLARDLSEAKSALSGALKELERERRSRKLLEDLCDEFASGIKEYEEEVHFMKQKIDHGDQSDRDRPILHVSESWLDERVQTKIEEARIGVSEKDSIVDKLRLEIEAFLRAKHAKVRKNPQARERRHSLESVHLNEAVSGPHDVDEDEDRDSLGSDSHCFELQKPNNDHKGGENEAAKVRDERVKAGAGKRKDEEEEPEKASHETTAEDNNNNSKKHEKMNQVNAESYNDEASCSNNLGWRNQASPVRQWMAKLDIADSSTKLPIMGLKENTLKAKLLEARSKGRRSRQKASKVSC